MTEKLALNTAQKWLDAISHAEKAFYRYQVSCDRTAKKYANLENLASDAGDREFQMFWANMEIMKPSVYQRPPTPVVMPRHSQTSPIVRKASEMLERALDFDVEADDLHETLKLVRDDLCMYARGAPWVLDTGSAIHVDRKDFLHDPARKWREVTWVARRAYLSKEAGVDRFGDKWLRAEFSKPGKDREDDYKGAEEKAAVWEIWCKTSQKVYWVSKGCEEILDESDPMFDVKGFFPCPKPAYATLEPETLKPVPDFAYYRDQVDEINELTARIAALSESLRLKGFFAAGVSDIGEAIETAFKRADNQSILIPINNLNALGGGSVRDAIVWLPIREVAEVIRACIELRRQLMDDVYEITGLSDIMRGVTDAQETLGAQNLKAQYGSVRVQQKQAEMVRVSLDLISIKAEIFAEQKATAELAEMAQIKLPTMAEVMAQKDEAIRAAAMQLQGNPQQLEQAVQQIEATPEPVTIDAVAELLSDQKMRPFAMEIETDSTIAPNEQAEKQSRVEFLQAVGAFIAQAGPMVSEQPATAPLMAELLKFGAGAFRAGRDLGDVIDQFADQIKQMAAQPQQAGPDPEMMKAQMQAQKDQADIQIKQAEMQIRQQEIAAQAERNAAEMAIKQRQMEQDALFKGQQFAIQMQGLGIQMDEQRMKERQAEIDALLAVEEIELEREQKRGVQIGDDT